jgi:hypothetical protein
MIQRQVLRQVEHFFPGCIVRQLIDEPTGLFSERLWQLLALV